MRQSLELGQQTAGILQQVQRELDPVIKDVKAVAADVRAMVAEFRKANDLEKISKALDKLATNGALDATLKAIQSLPAKLDALTKRSPQGGTMEVPVLPTEDKGEL